MQLNEIQPVISSGPSDEYCIFEYLYRDASNYKAWGKILLSGIPTQNEIGIVQSCLESGEYFVAEQVGIPVLYKEMWKLSGGPSSNDHAFHEFVALRGTTEDERDSLPLFGNLANLLKTFISVTKWDCSRSPNS